MTDDQLKQVFEILMNGVPEKHPAYPFLADLTWQDVAKLEPAIDGFLEDAKGKL